MADLKSKVDSAVVKAFKKVDSLLKDGVFSTKTVTGFDYSAGMPTSTQTGSKTVRVFVEEKLSRVENLPVVSIKAYFKSDGANYTIYDTFTVETQAYKPLNVADNGYIVIMELERVR